MSVAAEIDRLLAGEDLGREGAQQALSTIMAGEIDPVQTGAFLIALRAKGETASEIAGLATAVRDHALAVEPPAGVPLVDTCGTGGGVSTFNVSTAAAFVAAGAGAVVAKHGNRSATSKSGSADVLEALGARIDLDPEAIRTCMERSGVGFMFAPNHHPAFRHVVPVRRALAVRTIFNILGPLANPSGVRRQVIGVSDRTYLERIAEALGELGAERAFVVSSDDGMDELSISAPSEIAEVRPDGIHHWRFDPADCGIPRASLEAFAGGDPDENAQTIRSILDGAGGAAADLVAVNAAAALVVAGLAESIADALDAARDSIRSGAAADRLATFIATTHELAPVDDEV